MRNPYEDNAYAMTEGQRLYEERQRFDPAGHYNRPDVLRFELRT